MATVNAEVFHKFSKARKLPSRPEADGHEVEVREDEEQSVKLQEIIDLLVAAGYFRARIKGLSPFDKVVGGMTWCIESCNVDVDVDLLFQENSTIGQKIALTEKIVAVLPKLKCPHQIEPHQIQGLDFIHIFPVIQWLVKRSMEYRQEMSAFVRVYAVNQFTKEFEVQNKELESQKRVLQNLKTVKEVYRPHRYFKRKTAPPSDLDSRVQVTLLEYGHSGLDISKNSSSEAGSSKEESLEQQKLEEKQIQQLLSNLTATKEEILGYEDLNEEERSNLAKHYASLHLELKDGGSQTRENQQVAVLEEQQKILIENCEQLKQKQQELDKILKHEKAELEEIRLKQSEADKALKELEENQPEDEESMREVEELVILNDSLKSQEIQFRDHCKQELVRLQQEIQEAKNTKKPVEKSPVLNTEIEEVTEIIKQVRLQLAKKNRVVSSLQRQLDDVPNRAELAQYQRRFIELYNQVAAKHKETKQYYTLFNTLEDTRLYMQKELSLLNSISENYPDAIQSSGGREEFLKQLQNIVEGVRQSKIKVERKVAEEKRKKDILAQELQMLIELQRKYVSAVRLLKEECKKHEELARQKDLNRR